MHFAQVQAVLERKQEYDDMDYIGTEYTSPGSRRLFELSNLVLLDRQHEVCSGQTVGKACLREGRSQRVLANLDEALAGGRQKWLLAGYYISSEGLTIRFLPKMSTHLQREAERLESKLQGMDETSRREWSNAYAERIYSEYAVKLVLTGRFQFWFNTGPYSSDIVSCDGRRVLMLSIDDGRKEMRVRFPFAKGEKPRQWLYF